MGWRAGMSSHCTIKFTANKYACELSVQLVHQIHWIVRSVGPRSVETFQERPYISWRRVRVSVYDRRAPRAPSCTTSFLSTGLPIINPFFLMNSIIILFLTLRLYLL